MNNLGNLISRLNKERDKKDKDHEILEKKRKEKEILDKKRKEREEREEKERKEREERKRLERERKEKERKEREEKERKEREEKEKIEREESEKKEREEIERKKKENEEKEKKEREERERIERIKKNSLKNSENYIYWFDKNYSKKNVSLIKFLTEKIEFKYEFKPFEDIEDGFDDLLNLKNFQYIYIFVNRKIYENFIYYVKKNINLIKFIPIIFIYKEPENIQNEMKELIGNNFYNRGNVVKNVGEFVRKLNNFNDIIWKDEYSIKEYPKYEDYKDCMIFENIDNTQSLILPVILTQLMSDNINISTKDIDEFNKLLLKNYYSEKIGKLFRPICLLNDIPLEIISKVYLRAYTMGGAFYRYLNLYLMENNNNADNFSLYIKIMYKVLEKNIYKLNSKQELYRSTLINKREMDALESYIKEKQNKNNNRNSLPVKYVYSKAFLSFSKSQNRALKFFKKSRNENYINVLFYIKGDDINFEQTLSSHIDLDINNLSYYPEEEEVLFLPFSCFTIEKIEDKIFKKIDYNELKDDIQTKLITINYLGKYREEIRKEFEKFDVKNLKENLDNNEFAKNIMTTNNILFNENKSIDNNINKEKDKSKIIAQFKTKKNQIKNILENNIEKTPQIHETEKNEIKQNKDSNLCQLKNNYLIYSHNKKLKILKYNKGSEKKLDLQFEIKDENLNDSVNYIINLENEKIIYITNKKNYIQVNSINYNLKKIILEQNIKIHNGLITKLIEYNNHLITSSFDGTIKIQKYNENFKQYDFEKILLCKNRCLFYNIINFENLLFGTYRNTESNKTYLFRINLDNEQDYIEIVNNDILLKKNNILIFGKDKNQFCVSGIKKYFIYDFKLNEKKQIPIKYNISYFKIHSNGDIICGGDKGEIFIIENLYDGEIVMLDLTKHQKEIKSIICFEDDVYISNDKLSLKIWSLKQN